MKTPPLNSEFRIHRDVRNGKDVLVCAAGKTVQLCDARYLQDQRSMLKAHGDWMELAQPTSRKTPRTEPSKPGGGLPQIRLAVGTASSKACAADSACMCRH